MARVADLRVYPVKGLDGVAVDRSDLTPGGTLAHDREFALFDPDDEPINGKRTPEVHRIDASYHREGRVATFEHGGETRTFDLQRERDPAASWLGTVLDAEVRLERNEDTGHVDRPEAGPSVVSTATLQEVASWFDDLTVEGVRRRLRANVEVGGVPAFWEDRFVGEDAPAFEAGGVRLDGVTPCGRCVVPTRDPDTGEALDGFRERFLERREATFPDWADPDAFEHFYTLMLIARVPESDREGTLAVGDEVAVVER